MANGQTLYQAPQSNLQNLAMQYTQGMAQVNQIKGQVRAAKNICCTSSKCKR